MGNQRNLRVNTPADIGGGGGLSASEEATVALVVFCFLKVQSRRECREGKKRSNPKLALTLRSVGHRKYARHFPTDGFFFSHQGKKREAVVE